MFQLAYPLVDIVDNAMKARAGEKLRGSPSVERAVPWRYRWGLTRAVSHVYTVASVRRPREH